MNAYKRLYFKQIFSPEYIFLFVATFFTRFPFFFRDYIDRDESTFILIGKSITDGHLPYDHMWDLKPPLLFYIFAFIQFIFPDSLIAIRFFGVLIVFISAVVLMQIAKTVGAKNTFAIGLSYVILSSLFGSLQGIMSEHVAVLFFLPALLLFLKNKGPFNLFLSGFLFGCALLCKLNYAYTVAALLLYYFISDYKSTGFITLIKNIIIISIGVILPTIIIAIPYVLQDKLKLYIDSVFMATLEYGHKTKVTALDKLKVAAWIIILGTVISYVALRYSSKDQKKYAAMFVTLLVATIFTFYSSHTLNGHYLVQIYPFMAILIFGFTLKKEFKPGYLKYAIIVLLLCIESYIEYYRIFKNYSEQSTFYNGKAFTSINELKKHGLENKKIFFADHHIGYWFLHQYPLTRSVTHPSSLSRPDFFKHFGDTRNTMEELKYIMEDINPEVIVSRKQCLSFFLETDPENIYFMDRMKNYYELIYQNQEEKIFIWKKK
jgi:4-amino-4-deoxy-L-arabinose transferase-like glycosyltransferase